MFDLLPIRSNLPKKVTRLNCWDLQNVSEFEFEKKHWMHKQTKNMPNQNRFRLKKKLGPIRSFINNFVEKNFISKIYVRPLSWIVEPFRCIKKLQDILLLLFALFVYGVRDNLKTSWQAATICFSDEKKRKILYVRTEFKKWHVQILERLLFSKRKRML